MPRIGFFGKLPTKGDFLTRALPPEVLSVWEKWLESSMAGAKQQLGARWSATYERGPVWRFWIGARLTGHAMTGVVAPSVDRVGRQFPLSFVLTGSADVLPAAPLAGEGNGPWYDALDRAAMEARHPRFEGDLDGLLDRLPLPAGARQAAVDDSRAAFFAYGEAGLAQLMEDVRAHDHQLVASNRSYWWTAGNDFTGPAMVALNGMPDARGFAALLQGFGPPVRAVTPTPTPADDSWDAVAPAPAAPAAPDPVAEDMGWTATIPPTEFPDDLRPEDGDAAETPLDEASPFRDSDGASGGAEDDPWSAALSEASVPPPPPPPEGEEESAAPDPEPDVPPAEVALEEPRPETSPVSDPWAISDDEDRPVLAEQETDDPEPVPEEKETATVDTALDEGQPDQQEVEDPAPIPDPPMPEEEEDSPFGTASAGAEPAPRKSLRGLFGRRDGG